MQFNNVAKVTFVNFCTRFHLYIHVYALYLQSRGLSLLQISTIESVVIATRFLAEIPTGLIADRLGRKWSIVVSNLFLMSGETLFFFKRDYPLVLVVAVLTGLGFAFGSGASEALVYDSLDSTDRDFGMKQAMGRIGAFGQVAFFLSPIIGSAIVGKLEPERISTAIAVTVLSLFVGVLISLTLSEPRMQRLNEPPNTLKILRLGFAELRQNRRLRQIVLFSVFTTSFGGTLVTTLGGPYLALNGVSLAMVGIALSIGSLVSGVAQGYAFLVERKLGSGRTLIGLTLLPGLLYLLLAILSGPIPIWLLITLQYGVGDMKAPLLSGYQNQAIESASRATILSMIAMCVNLFIAVMGPVYAALGSLSLPLAFLTMGTVILIAGWRLRITSDPQT